MRAIFVAFAILTIVSFATSQPPDTSWTYTQNYVYTENVQSVRAIDDGGFIACGFTRYDGDFFRSWIMRGDENGDELWTLLEYGGISDASDYIEPTSDGGFINCGETWSYSPYIGWDGYVRKLNADGETDWFRLISSYSNYDYAFCAREVPTGGYIVAGMVEFVPFLLRLGPQGNTIWMRTYPDQSAWETMNFVEPTQDGGFLIASEYPNQFNIAKVNDFGYIQWTRQYQPDGTDLGEARCVREAADGSIYACGSVRTYPISHGWYVIKADSEGNLVWDDLIDLNNYKEVAHGLVITPDGNIVVTGELPEPNNPRYALIKYDPDGNLLWQSIIEEGAAFSVDQMRDGGYIYGGEYRPTGQAESIAFHLIKTEPEVQIQMEAWTPVIPSSGGWLRYGAQVDNILLSETSFDAWTVVTGPNGTHVPLNGFPIAITPDQSITQQQIYVYVPANAPDGTYTFEGHIGVAPPDMPPGGLSGHRNMGFDSFTFTKGALTSVEESNANELAWPQLDDSWNPFTGQTFNPNMDQLASENDPTLPSEPTLTAYPNPFNAATRVSLSLPNPGSVRIAIYNSLGREVAVLANERSFQSGNYTFTLDATHLASGLYFVHAQVSGQHDIVQKLMLVR